MTGPGTETLAQRLRRLVDHLERHPAPPALQARLVELLEAWERTGGPGAGNGRGRVQSEAPGAAVTTGEFTPAADAPIEIWCDGSCAPNPGPGGWGAIVEQSGRRMELSGASPASTNNIMEMTAALEALARTPEGARVRVTTDSRYLMDGITKWMKGWKRRGWVKADGKPVLNQGLWKALDARVQPRSVTWHWVEGHSGHPENERCDELANRARRGG